MSQSDMAAALEPGVLANPFPGLRSFEFEESHLFFGRDGQSEQLITKLGRTHFVAVVGTSGSGKSSLVRAGLLPALLGGFMAGAHSEWRIAVMRPGNDPIGNLARSLYAPVSAAESSNCDLSIHTAGMEATLRRGSRGLVEVFRHLQEDNESLLLVVDQFEEIFRLARDSAGEAYQNQAAAFVKLFLEPSYQRDLPIYVVLTMRSDYLGDCSQFWGLPEAVNESQYLIPRLTRNQLREAITGPVAVGGGAIAPRLVNRLLNDVGDSQDQLPILQHALMRTWTKWKETPAQNSIDLEDYEAIGGMASALSLHADEAFSELSEDGQRVAEKLFKALTEKGPDNREIRRPITLAEACAITGATEAEIKGVVETFRQPGRSFLMPPADVPLHSESLLDISHESLIRGWQRLKAWVDEEGESARIYRRLGQTAELHQKGQAGLWGDPDLQLALDWKEKNRPNEHWARRYHADFAGAMDFLERSREQRAADLDARERRQAAEMERTRRELEQAQALAEVQRVRAEEQRQRLEEQTRAATRLRRMIMAAVALACLALAAAIAAFSAYRRAETLRKTAEAERRTAEAERKKADDAKTLADTKTTEAVASKKLAESNAEVALSSQLTAQADQLRSAAPRLFMQSLLLAIEAHRRFPGHESGSALRASLALAPIPGLRLKSQGPVETVAISPDGRYVFTAGRDKTLRVFDRTSGRELARLVHKWGVNTLAVNADASLVVCGTGDPSHDVGKTGIITQSEPTAGEAKVWDWRAKKELALLPFAAPVRLVVFVGNRDMVAASDSYSLKTAMFDRKGGFDVHEIVTTERGRGWISSFSGDGTLAAVRRPEEAEIIDLANSNVAGRVPTTKGEDEIVFSPDNKRVAATGPYGDTRIVDWADGKIVATKNRSTRTVFSPDGKLLLQIDDDGNARVSEIDRNEVLGVMSRSELLGGVVIDLASFLPDSKTLATTLDDAAVRVWRPYKTVNSNRVGFFELFRMAEDKIAAMSVSRDGRFLVTGDESGARVWELASGNEVKRWLGSERFTFGRRYAVTGAGRDLRVIDMKSDVQVAAISGDFRQFLFSPDESRVAVSTFGGAVEFRRVPDLALLRQVAVGKDIESMKFAGDGRSLAVAWGKGMITEINVNDTGRVDRVKTQNVPYQDISPHAKYFVQNIPTPEKGFLAANINVYERSGRKISSIQSQAYSSTIRFAPNDEFFVGHADNSTLGVWNSATGTMILRIPVDDPHSGFAISPDSRYVASPTGPHIAVWDIAARKKARVFDHFSPTVGSIAFSPDSRTLLANCTTLRVWSMDDAELKSVIAHDDYDDRSSFTPDGKYIVSHKDLRTGGATPYLSFQLWRPKDLIAEGCHRATRNMSDNEWQQYLHSEPKRKTCPDLP